VFSVDAGARWFASVDHMCASAMSAARQLFLSTAGGIFRQELSAQLERDLEPCLGKGWLPDE
jgi:hypothetical protein